MSELKYWVWLSMRFGVRPKAKLELLEHFGGPRNLYFASEADYRAAAQLRLEELRQLSEKDLDEADRVLGLCCEKNIQIITIRDAAYPQRLRHLYDPPVVLYVRGRLPDVDDCAAVAIVGTRSATPYGARMASSLGYDIVKCGGIVVSGMTRGVDAAGAVGALRANGTCIGVSGKAIDDPFGGELAQDIAAKGAVISEYAPGMQVPKVSFRLRNRITAGLAVATVVVEAPERSGALLFADEAVSQGREVFAVPGNADAYNSAGTNALLKDGARPATCGWDVLCDFSSLFPGKLREYSGEPLASQPNPPSPNTEPRETGENFVRLREPISKKVIDNEKTVEYIDLEDQLKELSASQLQIIAAMETPHIHVDDIIEKSQLPAAKVLAELTVLQIQGFVRQEQGKRFSLNVRPRMEL